MINEILTATGRPYRETQFLAEPPAGTYAVYMDDVTADGPDNENRIFSHDLTVEWYEPKPDPKTEAAFEAELNRRGIKWTKQARYWIKEVKRYQVIYEFSYTIKT